MSGARQKQYSITEARKNLPSLVHEAEKGTTVELTRRGKRVAVLLSAREYATLTGASPELWPSLQSFRRHASLQELDVEEIYRDTRDRSPGREVPL